MGYRDIFPITESGGILTACISIIAIGVLALTVSILESPFSAEFQKLIKKKDLPALWKGTNQSRTADMVFNQ